MKRKDDDEDDHQSLITGNRRLKQRGEDLVSPAPNKMFQYGSLMWLSIQLHANAIIVSRVVRECVCISKNFMYTRKETCPLHVISALITTVILNSQLAAYAVRATVREFAFRDQTCSIFYLLAF